MIKPDAIEKGYTEDILKQIEAAGFKIVSSKHTQLSKEKAETFYAAHKERAFFEELIAFITRGQVVVMILEKENAVDDFRTLIGATDPKEAAEGTIRKLYGSNVGENAIHGSDSDESVDIEGTLHFSASLVS